MTMIGIDLGTTNSLVCVYRNKMVELIPNGLGKFITPSAVSLLDDGTILIGEAARERLISHPKKSAAYFKSFMGTDKQFEMADKTWTAHELSALVLQQLKRFAEDYLGEAVEEAIISVPAYFNDNQRNATRLAGKLAGLKVERIINEPSAAALRLHTESGEEENKILVIDFGGGTFDVSLVDCFENMIEIIAIAGDNHLGGRDIDTTIVEYFCNSNNLDSKCLSPSQLSSLYRKAEQAKISCRKEQTITIALGQEYSATLTPEILGQICEPLFLRARQVIADVIRTSGVSASTITKVALVGGSCKFEPFLSFLEKLLGKRPRLVENPEEIVAVGIGLCTAIKNREISDIVMTDVCPFSLGIGIHNPWGDRLLMSVLIERNSLLPSRHSERFVTVSNNQTQIRCQIYQGEQRYVDSNLKIGEVTIDVPPGPRGSQYVDLAFSYDIDGILHVEAKGSGGNTRKALITNPLLSFDETELEDKLEELQRLRVNTDLQEEDRLMLANLERLYAELTGPDRDYVGQLHGCYQEVLRTGSLIHKKKLAIQIKKSILNYDYQLNSDPFMILNDDEDTGSGGYLC